VDTQTSLYGLIGHPVAHSLGPVVHNAAFEAMGVNAVYLAFDTVDPGQCVSGMRALGIRGLSVTLPHKESILDDLDHVGDTVRKIGAVNTLVNWGGRIEGHNTDAQGVLHALEAHFDPRGKTALILGAGGAARSAAFALKGAGARVAVANRSEARGRALARAVEGRFVHPDALKRLDPDIVVQATPQGMTGGPKGNLFPDLALERRMTVLETVYSPVATGFLTRAMESGCRVVNGLEMFLHQGAEQLRLWTGLEPPLDVMRRAAARELEVS